MRRSNTEIKKHGIEVNIMIDQEGLKIRKIHRLRAEAIRKDLEILGGFVEVGLILVDSDDGTSEFRMFKNSSAMASKSEGGIDDAAAIWKVEPVENLLEEDAVMLNGE